MPVLTIVVITWLGVKAIVEIYNFTRGFLSLGLVALILGTIICYKDWRQVCVLLCIYGMILTIFLLGLFIETGLEHIGDIIMKIIIE